jgi:hypothetical protein
MGLFARHPHRALVKQAYQAFEAEDWARAADLLEEAALADPDSPDGAALWFDAALAHKFRRDWPRAYALGKEAAARVTRGQEEPAFWNLGIAATILRDWATARDAWTGYGVTLQDGEGEIVEDFGMTAIRIGTPDGQEVVWGQRLCPARARVLSVPFDPARRYGEVVVHDGAPNGERIVDGRHYPVFDELVCFEKSDLATLSVTVTAAEPDDVDALLSAFQDRDLGAEVLGSGVMLCKCCSEGSPAVQRFVSREASQTVLLAAPADEASGLLDAWRAASADARAWENLHTAG